MKDRERDRWRDEETKKMETEGKREEEEEEEEEEEGGDGQQSQEPREGKERRDPGIAHEPVLSTISVQEPHSYAEYGVQLIQLIQCT